MDPIIRVILLSHLNLWIEVCVNYDEKYRSNQIEMSFLALIFREAAVDLFLPRSGQGSRDKEQKMKPDLFFFRVIFFLDKQKKLLQENLK